MINNTRCKGFTLIELLVVIAIIAILAAILFPVFATAREKARQVACLSNAKQLAIALQQYTQDYDETFPAGYTYSGYPGRGWVGFMYPYIKSLGVLVCPSDNGASTKGGWSMAFNSNLAGLLNPVQHTTFDVGSSTNVSVGNPVLVSQCTSPAKTVAMFEISEPGMTHVVSPVVDSDYRSIASTGIGWRTLLFSHVQFLATGYMWGDNDDAYYAGVMGYTAPYPVQPGRHNNGSCYVMADGHAKWFLPKMVAAGKSANVVSPAKQTTWCESDASGGNPASGTECASTNIAATFSYY